MILRIKDVEKETGLKKSSIYAMVQRGEFPRQIKVGLRASGWDAEEIKAWKASRIAERDAALVAQGG